ncbi:hypothetical protein KC19_8G055500 [Ceratodon purpureus]|uniref:Transmembrane protein n=1 Tax=Ceratodon purpureus TaxID=3225 RepID=A0A8T0GZ65_CERPU|nr:hypothetical protein KC19_8G055500 [Ceratodon purpureus]
MCRHSVPYLEETVRDNRSEHSTHKPNKPSCDHNMDIVRDCGCTRLNRAKSNLDQTELPARCESSQERVLFINDGVVVLVLIIMALIFSLPLHLPAMAMTANPDPFPCISTSFVRSVVFSTSFVGLLVAGVARQQLYQEG